MASIKSEKRNDSSNGNNGNFNYDAMIKGLISLCRDDELVICLDKNGVVKHIKNTTRNKLLHNGNELRGRCMWDLMTPDLAERRKAVFSRVLASGEAERYEDEHDGHWFDSMVYPIFDK